MSEQPQFIIEEKKRFSQSKLWDLQRKYYDQIGANAWRKQIVPHEITSNAYIASQYARLVYAYLQDWEAEIDKDHPVYIVELGTGSGRFSYHFIRKFLERRHRFGDLGIQFTYVMTDFTEKNINFWKSHPLVQLMLKEGVADFALFDVVNDDSFTLINSGETISASTLVNPMVAIANYIFDSIPLDIFYSEDGNLFESLLTIYSETDETDGDAPDSLDKFKLRYDNQPVTSDYYDNDIYNEILENYRQEFRKTYFRFPTTTLDCCARLNALCGGRLMVITADKGFLTVDSMDLLDEPQLAIHGSMSMMINFDAIGQFFRLQNGIWLKPFYSPKDISITVGLTGDNKFSSTRLTYADTIESFSADDYHSMKEVLHGKFEDMSVRQMLAVMRMGQWDWILFEECFQHLQAKVKDEPETVQLDVRYMVHRVWETYYYIGEANDIAFKMGAILHNIGAFKEAITMFNFSLQMHGLDAGTLYNLGMSHLYSGETDKALTYISQAADDGQFEPAIAMRKKILDTLNQAR